MRFEQPPSTPQEEPKIKIIDKRNSLSQEVSNQMKAAEKQKVDSAHAGKSKKSDWPMAYDYNKRPSANTEAGGAAKAAKKSELADDIAAISEEQRKSEDVDFSEEPLKKKTLKEMEDALEGRLSKGELLSQKENALLRAKKIANSEGGESRGAEVKKDDDKWEMPEGAIGEPLPMKDTKWQMPEGAQGVPLGPVEEEKWEMPDGATGEPYYPDNKWQMPEGAEGVPLGPVEQMEPDEKKELNLAAARERFARADIDRDKAKKRAKREGVMMEVDSEEYDKAREEYKNILNAIRAEKYAQAKKEVAALGLSPEEEKIELQKRAEDILKETLTLEAIELNDLEQNIRTEQKKGIGKAFEKMWKGALGVSERYQKMPLGKKLLISGGLIGAGLAVGVAGGVFAGAIGGGVIAARWAQRALSGVGTFRSIEGVTKRIQENRTEKRIREEFGGEELGDILDKSDAALDSRLFELNKQKDKQRKWRYAGAAAGAVLGSIAMSKIAGWAVDKIKGEFFTPGLEAGGPHPYKPGELDMIPPEELSGPETPPPGPETTAPPLDGSEAPAPETLPGEPGGPSVEGPGGTIGPETHIGPEVLSVDSNQFDIGSSGVWGAVENNLPDNYDNIPLSESGRSNIAGEIMKEIKANPEKFGLGDIKDLNNIPAGHKIDLSSLFNDPQKMQELYAHASGLSPEQVQNILDNNKLLNDWVSRHPGEKLTQKVIDTLLGHEVAGPEVPHPVEIQPSAPATEIPHPHVNAAETLAPYFEEGQTAANLEGTTVPELSEAEINQAIGEKITDVGYDHSSAEWGRVSRMTVGEVMASDHQKSTFKRVLTLGLGDSYDRNLYRLKGALEAWSGGDISSVQNQTVEDMFRKAAEKGYLSSM